MTYNLHTMPGPGDWGPPDDDGPMCCGDPLVHHTDVVDVCAEWDEPVPTYVLEWWCLHCRRTYDEHGD